MTRVHFGYIGVCLKWASHGRQRIAKGRLACNNRREQDTVIIDSIILNNILPPKLDCLLQPSIEFSGLWTIGT